MCAVLFSACSSSDDSVKSDSTTKITTTNSAVTPASVAATDGEISDTTTTTTKTESETDGNTTPPLITTKAVTTKTVTTPATVKITTATSKITESKPVSTIAVTTKKPVESAEIVPSNVEESAAVSGDYFDDAIFIGDSVSLKLKLYCVNEGENGKYPLGKATFFTSGSFSWGNSLVSFDSANSVHPKINGVKMQIPDAVKAVEAKKAYIMLGMNDIAPYGFDKTIENVDKITNQIHEKSPDTIIYIQSVTPMLTGKERSKLNNNNIHIFNSKLKELCNKKGYAYLDINSIMGGESLKREYCGDPDSMGIHFTNKACQVWIDYLKTHTAQ